MDIPTVERELRETHSHCFALMAAVRQPLAGARARLSALAGELDSGDPTQAEAIRDIFSADDALRRVEINIFVAEAAFAKARIGLVTKNPLIRWK
jgi:hypothetical protein